MRVRVCANRYSLYDYVVTESKGVVLPFGESISFRDLDEPHTEDPDPEAMAQAGDTGVCVDMVYLYQQSCKIKPLAQAVGVITGCGDTWFSSLLCGLSVDRVGPDGSGVSIEFGLEYPRTLVTATPDLDGDFLGTPELKCTDPLDCMNKCRLLESTSRDGMGAPPPCGLCDLPCPSNILSTVTPTGPTLCAFGLERLAD